MNKIVFRLFIFILIFSPLAFGTVEQWSFTVMETLALLALCLLLFNQMKERKPYLFDIPGIMPLILLLAYMLIQLIPLPSSFVKLISSNTYALYRETAGIVEPLGWIPLTINKKRTLIEFFRITAYASLYILAVQLLAKKEYLKKTVMVIIIFASLLSLFAIVQHLLSSNKIYYFRELTKGGSPFGPYVNRNHYAGFMAMVFPIVLSVFLFYKPDFTYGSLRERIADFFDQKVTNRHLLIGFSSVLIALSIFLSLSRAGIIALTLSMILFGALIVLRVNSRRGMSIIILFVLILCVVGWFGWEPIFERFETIRDVSGDISEKRFEFWNDSINIIRDYPLTGTGFGSFAHIYPKYRSISSNYFLEHPHNDYLELFIEGGMIAVILFIWFIAAVFYRSYRIFIKRRELYSRYLFIGSMTGIISMLIHSLTDFGLHIGANSLYFFFLIGLAVSAAHTRFHENKKTYLETIKLSKRTIIFGTVSVLLIACTLFNISLLAGQFYYFPLKDKNLEISRSTIDLYRMKDRALKASRFDRLEAEYQYYIAQIYRLLGKHESAAQYHRKALQLDPVNAQHLQMYGLVLSELRQDSAAEKLLLAGIRYDRKNTLRYQIYAPWLFDRDKKDAGIDYLKKAISIEPEKTRQYIAIMVLNGLRDEEIMRAIPENSVPHVHFADYLVSTGNDGIAENVYLKALAYTEKEKDIHTSVFMKIYNYYRDRRLYNNALYVMKKAADKLPDTVYTRLITARAYEEAGLIRQAIEHYKEVLARDPNNKRAKLRLEKLVEDSNK
jgi:O-antigen ligase/cytochrome c-type biogenesis protein CcmH/NrfG